MHETWTRRGLLQGTVTVGATALVTAPRIARAVEEPQRTIIIMSLDPRPADSTSYRRW
jgi:hypothetical protein